MQYLFPLLLLHFAYAQIYGFPTTVFPGSTYSLNISLGQQVLGNVTAIISINSTMPNALFLSCNTHDSDFSYLENIKNLTSSYTCTSSYPMLLLNQSLEVGIRVNPILKTGNYTINLAVLTNNGIAVPKITYENNNTTQIKQNFNLQHTKSHESNISYEYHVKNSTPTKTSSNDKQVLKDARSPISYSYVIGVVLVVLASTILLFIRYLPYHRK